LWKDEQSVKIKTGIYIVQRTKDITVHITTKSVLKMALGDKMIAIS
jgi:hypothetical protein